MKLFNFSKKQIRENVVTKQSYILIAKESFIDHIRCIHETGCCYWRKKHGKGDKKMEVGDIVYLFISDKIHDRVMYRMEVASTYSTRDDAKYWKVKFEPDNDCFKFQNISPAYTGIHLNRQDLEDHGIKRQILYKKLNQEQADWLEKYF